MDIGIVVAWHGLIANIPAGYALCDGTGGTPDLRDTFIIGAKEDQAGVAKTNITGALTVSGGNRDHTHLQGDIEYSNVAEGDYDCWKADVVSAANPTVAVPYYALAWIKRVAS